MAYVPSAPAVDNEALTDVEQVRDNCDALRIDEAGATAPTNPVAFMNWLYTPVSGNWVVKRRNASNTAWFDLYEINPTTGAMIVSGAVERIRIIPEAMNTKIGTGYAAYYLIEGTYALWGEMRFDAESEICFLPPFKLANWDESTLTVRIFVKSDSITGNGQFRVSLVGRDAEAHEVWEAPFTDHNLDAFAVPGTQESLVEVSADLTPSELAVDDVVYGKLTRIDTPGPTTLKVVAVEFEYTRV